jgi:hypothetical protein
MQRIDRVSQDVGHEGVEYSGSVIEDPVGRRRRGKDESWKRWDHDVGGCVLLIDLSQWFDYGKEFMERS